MRASDQQDKLSQTPVIRNKTAFIVASLASIGGYLYYRKQTETQETSSYGDLHKADQEQKHYFQSLCAFVRSTYLYQSLHHYLQDEQNEIIFASVMTAIFLLLLILWLSRRVTFSRLNRWIQRKKAPFFADQISPAEFESQCKKFTKKEVQKLFVSNAYAKMKRDKGDDVKRWNWQLRARRPLDEVREEEEYLQNVEIISHQEEQSVKAKGFSLNLKAITSALSTKESS